MHFWTYLYGYYGTMDTDILILFSFIASEKKMLQGQTHYLSLYNCFHLYNKSLGFKKKDNLLRL